MKNSPRPQSSPTYGGISSAAVERKTGKPWETWLRLLDRAGAKAWDHKTIVAWLSREHQIGPWWRQMLTVGYEQARGKRERHQTAEGYRVNASRTLPASATALYVAWTDARLRARWLKGGKLTITSKTPRKSIRGVWSGANSRERIDVGFFPRGPGKAQVAVEHRRLASQQAVTRARSYWKARLEALGAAVSRKP